MMGRSDEERMVRPGLRQERAQDEAAHASGGGDSVSSGHGIGKKSVDADHVIGAGGALKVATAEGESDTASAKANRHEAMEPQRERDEKAAIGGAREVPAKNIMGHGERPTIGRHTI